MNCKRCGFPLPSSGYVCTNCGTMMDSEQIKMQKERMATNPNSMFAQPYQKKEVLYQKREEDKKKYTGILFLIIIVLLLLLIGIFVYF